MHNLGQIYMHFNNMSKKTYEAAVRNRKEPAFLFVQSAIAKASEDKPDVLTFVSRLADQGIAVRPNLKQGELNGFGYSKNGQSFTGKQLGANWSQLKERVNYEPIKHLQTLADLKQFIDAGETRPIAPEPTIEPAATAVEGSSPELEAPRREATPEPTQIPASEPKLEVPQRSTSADNKGTPETKRIAVPAPAHSRNIERLVTLRTRMDASRNAPTTPTAPTPTPTDAAAAALKAKALAYYEQLEKQQKAKEEASRKETYEGLKNKPQPQQEIAQRVLDAARSAPSPEDAPKHGYFPMPGM